MTQSVHLSLYLVFLLGEETVSGQSASCKEQRLASGTDLRTTYVHEDIGFRPQVQGTEVTAIVHAFVALKKAYEVPCLHLGQSAQGWSRVQQLQYFEG